jgi:hypothetical protein
MMVTTYKVAPRGWHLPHALRRSYESLRLAAGDDPVYVAEQMGHSDPGFSMKTYARAVKRWKRLEDAEREQFALALEWAQWSSERAEAGRNGVQALSALPSLDTEKDESRLASGLLGMGGTGLEPVTPSLSSWCSPN